MAKGLYAASCMEETEGYGYEAKSVESSLREVGFDHLAAYGVVEVLVLVEGGLRQLEGDENQSAQITRWKSRQTSAPAGVHLCRER